HHQAVVVQSEGVGSFLSELFIEKESKVTYMAQVFVEHYRSRAVDEVQQGISSRYADIFMKVSRICPVFIGNSSPEYAVGEVFVSGITVTDIEPVRELDTVRELIALVLRQKHSLHPRVIV